LIRSMTSYGRGEFRTEDLLFVVEVRSVNHRYRDILLRLPKNLQSLEDALRNEISARFRRGRVEVSVQTQSYGDDCPITLKLNMPLVRAYQKVFEELADHFKVERHLSLDAFCQIKDVLIVEPKPVQMDKEEKALREALKQAMDSCDEMRIREGSAIENDMIKRLQLLEEYLEEMEKGAERVVEAYRTRLRANIQQLLQETTVDESRLAQEVAYYAERSDTTEEIRETQKSPEPVSHLPCRRRCGGEKARFFDPGDEQGGKHDRLEIIRLIDFPFHCGNEGRTREVTGTDPERGVKGE
jgi:uncharacterized protein (TIGR00255 family)